MKLLDHQTVKAKLYVTECYQNAMELAKEASYQLIAFLTDERAFPDSWKVYDLNMGCPTLVLTQVNQFHMGLLNQWIDTYLLEGASPRDKAMRESLQYIHNHLCDSNLSLDQAAAHVYISKYHYSRLFQKHMGVGFKEYIMRQRIKRAKVLLNGGESVTNTCYMVGYNDLTHFSKVFKRMVGLPPSKYRATNQSRNRWRRGEQYHESTEVGS
ncbi:helix-turn-helix transcriptional regulator [Xylanibacillus composti]|uniref:helix-turn-helix transcriptional regulator n=1 Tax=Xylanibacillus composti TaxID=1572762 RepID=UPI001BCE67C3|nr:helix-turn-helix transcriptional regulator [Xylanibacillus composti]